MLVYGCWVSLDRGSQRVLDTFEFILISDAVNRKPFSGKRRSLLWEVGMSKIDRISERTH